MTTPTPRTDANQFDRNAAIPGRQEHLVVDAEICREIERDLAAREASLRYVRETLDKALPGMDEGAPIEAIARKVAAHIAARDAELAAMKAENSKLRSALEIVHFKREPWQ